MVDLDTFIDHVIEAYDVYDAVISPAGEALAGSFLNSSRLISSDGMC